MAEPKAPANDVRPSLTEVTTRGVAWQIGQSLGTKAVNVVGTVVLAWLLEPKDFGLIALTFMAGIVASVISQAGLRDVLIHRQRRFDRWSNPAFWMSLVFGAAGALVLVASAPIAAWVFKEDRLLNMILLMSVPVLVDRLATVPQAKLVAQLRFRMVAALGLAGGVGTMALMVVFALLDFGVYSFIWPRVICTVVMTALLWYLAGSPPRPDPQFRRWRYLIADTSFVFVTTLLFTMIQQGDYFVLGVICDQQIVGLYFFAFNLSTQTATFFASKLSQVLFPALSSIDDPVRQTQAFLRTSRLSALITVPLCLLQAALADPVFRAVLEEKWHDAIPILIILSLGMMPRLVGLQGNSLIKAQGRFRTMLKFTSVYTVLFLVLVTAGTLWAQALGAAVAASVQFAIVGLVNLYVAIRPTGGTWSDVAGIYLRPLAAAVPAIGGASCAAALVPPMPGQHWIRIGLILLLSAGFGVPLTRRFAPTSYADLAGRLKEALRSVGGGLVLTRTPRELSIDDE